MLCVPIQQLSRLASHTIVTLVCVIARIVPHASLACMVTHRWSFSHHSWQRSALTASEDEFIVPDGVSNICAMKNLSLRVAVLVALASTSLLLQVCRGTDLKRITTTSQQKLNVRSTCGSFSKTVRFRVPASNANKTLTFSGATSWMQNHVSTSNGGQTLSVSFSCNCCHPQGQKCDLVCRNPGTITAAKGSSTISFSNIGNPKGAYGQILFSTHRSAQIQWNEAQGIRRRRRLLQNGKGGLCGG